MENLSGKAPSRVEQVPGNQHREVLFRSELFERGSCRVRSKSAREAVSDAPYYSYPIISCPLLVLRHWPASYLPFRWAVCFVSLIAERLLVVQAASASLPCRRSLRHVVAPWPTLTAVREQKISAGTPMDTAKAEDTLAGRYSSISTSARPSSFRPFLPVVQNINISTISRRAREKKVFRRHRNFYSP